MSLQRRIREAGENIRAGNLGLAAPELRSILTEAPTHPEALFLMSVLLLRSDRLTEAAEPVSKILDSQPHNREALSLLVTIHNANREFIAAAKTFQKIVDLERESSELLNRLGSYWLAAGDFTAAGRVFKRAIEVDRTRAESYFNLGLALKLSGRSYETFLTFKRSTELDPGFFPNYVELFGQMRILLNWQEGVSLLEVGLNRFPESPEMMIMVAQTYGKLGRIADAETRFALAMERDRANVKAYAHWLQEEGRFEEAIPFHLESIHLVPEQGQSYHNLSVAKRFEVDGVPFDTLLPPLLDGPDLQGEERMFLHYALAKTLESKKLFGPAMEQYDRANELAFALYHEHHPEDPDAVEAEHRALQKLYTIESLKKMESIGQPSDKPIFIVGMIRTGTTLLDQILASHPAVTSVGEQPFWQVSSGRVNRKWSESHDLDLVQRRRDIKELATAYLNGVQSVTQKKMRLVDKMPTNFFHIGLMTSVFPNAKFIHTRRSPMDTAVSIYTTFLGRGTQFAYNKQNIVSYYLDYLRLMDFWRSVLPPGRMLEIDYEKLVTDKERVIREVLDFCELPWNESCLHHEENRTQVSTPSLWTARQPVNSASVERWKSYEPWLGELLALQQVEHPSAQA